MLTLLPCHVRVLLQLLQELTAFLPMNWVSLADSSQLANFTDADMPLLHYPQPLSSRGNSSSYESRPSYSLTGPKCPHVIAFYDAYTDPDSHTVSMVLEYMNSGTLQVSK